MAVKKTVKRTVTTRQSEPSGEKPRANRSTGSGTSRGRKSEKGPAEELNSLLAELSGEEISWLITQARTMIYNHKVEEVNKAAVELAETKKKTSKGTGKSGKSAKSGSGAVDVEPTGNGKSFVIIMGGKRLFVSLSELKTLVRFTQVTDDPADGSKRIFGWMGRERTDMINDAAVSGPGDPRLPLLFGVLRDKFTVG